MLTSKYWYDWQASNSRHIQLSTKILFKHRGQQFPCLHAPFASLQFTDISCKGTCILIGYPNYYHLLLRIPLKYQTVKVTRVAYAHSYHRTLTEKELFTGLQVQGTARGNRLRYLVCLYKILFSLSSQLQPRRQAPK